MENKICVYAICKNESQFVDKWVESMKEADSIVVLDTGSTDDTVAQFKKYGSLVTIVEKQITPWRFDTARNEAMALIPEDCNICVSTDLDEVFEPGWATPLRTSWIEGTHKRCLYKYAWSHLPNKMPGRVFTYDKIHSKDWVWKHPVHETLVRDIVHDNGSYYTYEEALNLSDSIFLHHYPDNTKSRGSYLPLLELRYEESPTDYYGRIYLAHEYYYRGMYEKSIKVIDEILSKFSCNLNKVEFASCYLFKGDSYSAIENKETEAIQNYLMAITVDDTYREPYINLAKVLNRLKRFNESVFYLKTALNNSIRHYTWLERDISWTYEPWQLLSVAEFYSGNKKDALTHALKAFSYDTTNENLNYNVDIILKMSSDIELI